MDNRLLIFLAVIAFAFVALSLHKSQNEKPPESGEGSGGTMDEPSSPDKKTRPVTPEIIPVSRPGGGLTISSDPVGSFGGYHSGISSPDIRSRSRREITNTIRRR